MSKTSMENPDDEQLGENSDLQTQEDIITRQQWKASALAGMASYLDAGSIVALGAGLALFQSYLHLSNIAVGALAAVGPNAIGCAIGSFIGGRLGDKLGRKRIYQYDLLVYAAGILFIALAMDAAMLFIGTFMVGLAVGADVPTSLALVGEIAPAKARGKLLGLTQVAWSLGPVIVLLMSAALAPFGLLGIRIVFMQLFVVASVTWALRRKLTESDRWKAAVKAAQSSEDSDNKKAIPTAAPSHMQLRKLFSGANLRALIWTGIIYLFWNLAAGTAGIFNPYFINKLHAGSQAVSVALPSFAFIVMLIVTATIFMRYSDRNFKTRKIIWGVGAIMQIAAYILFLVLPFNIPVIIINIVLFAAGASLAGEAFYKVFSQELFPTLLRGSAQGLTFGFSRFALGIWSFFVPLLAGAGIRPVAGLLVFFLVISGGVGFFFMPDTSGKTLEEIEQERI